MTTNAEAHVTVGGGRPPDEVLTSSMKNVEIIDALAGLRFRDYTERRIVELDVGVRNFILDAVAARCGKASG